MNFSTATSKAPVYGQPQDQPRLLNCDYPCPIKEVWHEVWLRCLPRKPQFFGPSGVLLGRLASGSSDCWYRVASCMYYISSLAPKYAHALEAFPSNFQKQHFCHCPICCHLDIHLAACACTPSHRTSYQSYQSGRLHESETNDEK